MILAGDVGGTKVRLGLFRLEGETPRPVARATFASADYPGLGPVVAEFLGRRRGAKGGVDATDTTAAIEAACFGVAGPVAGNTVATTNLPWRIDGDRVAAEAGVPTVTLVNDLVAAGEGIAALADDELVLLNPATAAVSGPAVEEGNAALIAPGTGLGMAILPRLGGRLVPVASEGGHMTFAARTDEEIGLLRHLQGRYGHVSVERVVSGMGIANVYDYLRTSGFASEDPELARRLAAADDPAPEIARAALAGGDPLAAKALDLFAAAFGAAAGHLALLATATAGVYLGGGIPPKILPKLRDGAFLAAFADQGRFRGYVERIPVRVITNPETALLGAARVAARRAG
jgi:glucokinase